MDKIKLEHRLDILPAFDRRNSDPNKNYGIHGVEMRFYVIGEKGVVQFVLYTNWQLPEVQKEMDMKMPDTRYPYLLHTPQPADIGYHSHVPQYEGQEPTKDCQFMDPCYYDGSVLQAEEFFKIMLEEGSEGLWKAMEKRYEEWLGEAL